MNEETKNNENPFVITPVEETIDFTFLADFFENYLSKNKEKILEILRKLTLLKERDIDDIVQLINEKRTNVVNTFVT